MNTKPRKQNVGNSPRTWNLVPGTSPRGMTLVEAVVWVSITSMIMLSIVQSVQYFYRANSYTIEQATAISSAQRGVGAMIKTMREATYSSNGAWPVLTLATSSISFYADIDDDQYI